jgi:ABC-type polysaccharide/polyol phosphate transport system ATPase subunit
VDSSRSLAPKRAPLRRSDLAAQREILLELDAVGKRYSAARQPNRAERAFARLGGLELDLSGIDSDDDDEDDDPQESPSASKGPNRKLAFDGVSVSFEAGTIVGVDGASRDVVSTLLQIASGTLPPTSGRVIVHGRLVAALSSFVRVHLVGQSMERSLFLLGNLLRIPRRELRAHIPEIFELAGAVEHRRVAARSVPPHVKNAILLAFALTVPADIVLVDVPLAPDDLGRRAVERLREIRNDGGLVLLAAGVEEVSRFADRVVYLDRDGTVIADASPATVAAAVHAHRDRKWTAVLQSDAAKRDLPLSPDAVRYLDFLRLLVGEERADEALRRAVAMAAPTAERVEWTGIAKHGGFDRTEHAPVVERLRRSDRAAADG